MLNFQAVVSQFFEWQTSLVVYCPLPFLLLPPTFTCLITYLTFSDLHLNVSNDTLRVFLPDNIAALQDLNELLELFPPRDALRDSYSIFGTSFVYTVYEADGDNALEPQGIIAIAKLHAEVKAITSRSANLSSVCLLSPLTKSCAMHPFVFALEDSDPVFSAQLLLRYPLLVISNYTIDNAVVFGGVQVLNRTRDQRGNAAISKAKAVRILYSLDTGPKSDEWIDAFLALAPHFRSPNAKIHFSSSRSLAKEMERNGQLLIPWMPWMSLVLVLFCMFICSSRNSVRSQPLVGLFAMLNATLATIASTSLLLYLQFPFLPLVFIMPFLVISIGTDNMFLMLKSWRMGEKKEFRERFIDALTETSASLFLTSLTDGLSFSIGSISEFYAVRQFPEWECVSEFKLAWSSSIRSGIGSACWLIDSAEELSMRSILYVLCDGDSLHVLLPETASLSLNSWGIEIARLLIRWPIRLAVFFIYLVYIVVAVNCALSLPLGLDLKLLAPDDSYVASELRLQERLFNDYGAFCFGVIRTRGVDFGDPLERRKLVRMYHNMTSGPLASAAEFWMVDFEATRAAGKEFSRQQFTKHLLDFLSKPSNEKFKSDIRFSLDGRIEAIKFIMRIRAVDPANDEPRARFLRDALAEARVDGFVYETRLESFENTLAQANSYGSRVLTMLAISTLLVPRLASALCVALAILSINIGVVGALSAVSTRLDIISMITIVMSVGFSVDYVVHTTFHFVTQKNNRLERCLAVMVEPVLQSALSTAVGVMLLAFVPSYIVRTFVFTVLFVVAIGVVHGLIFLPALLITVVPSNEYLEPYHKQKEASLRRILPIAQTQHHVARIGCYQPSTPPESQDYDIPPAEPPASESPPRSSKCSPPPLPSASHHPPPGFSLAPQTSFPLPTSVSQINDPLYTLPNKVPNKSDCKIHSLNPLSHSLKNCLEELRKPTVTQAVTQGFAGLAVNKDLGNLKITEPAYHEVPLCEPIVKPRLKLINKELSM